MLLEIKNSLKDRLSKDLGFNPSYIREIPDNRAICLVSQYWLDDLQSEQRVPNQFIVHDELSESECAEWLYSRPEVLPPSWTLVLINTITKQSCRVYRLADSQSSTNSDRNLSFSQLMHYVSETNYRNIWKDGRRKKIQPGKRDFQSYNSCIREGLRRLYGCPLVQKHSNEQVTPQHSSNVEMECHPNILPALVAVECSRHFHVFHPLNSLTLYDCLTFSPCVLALSTGRMLFVIHQLLHALRHIHDLGLHWGNLATNDVTIGHDLWMKIIPRFWEDLKENNKDAEETKADEPQPSCSPEEMEPRVPRELVDSWVKGQIGNFEYLMELNKLAGREWGNPRNHPVLPWVMDLTVPHGGWRDLGKSKFRLNKGDRQLDLTYESGHQHRKAASSVANTAVQVPHHITEVLSDITYYVYKARVTPRSVLCRHVRSKWVPAEYPASMQRMQEWTPDECIPEFYTDPSIFRSIHSDLADLEVPWWSSDPTDFVQKHMAALESDHVSERLHHWIDLTFGCRLSGREAVRSKNVCLPLVDGHTTLDSCGMVQLFSSSHPHRLAHSLYTGRKAPKTFRTINQKSIYQAFKARDQSDNADKEATALESKESGDDDSSSLSEGSASKQERKKSLIRSKSQMVYSSPEISKWDCRPEQQTIVLPKDYNPLAALNQLECLQSFSVSGVPESCKDVQPIEDWSWHQQHQQRKTHDLLVLGCLIGQMSLPNRCHTLPKLLTLRKRYALLHQILLTHAREIPRCVCRVLELLLQTDLSQGACAPTILPVRFPPVTSLGLPPPSAHQLLQPLVGVIPFASYSHHLYAFLVQLAEFDQELEKNKLDSCVLSQVSESKVLFASSHLRDIMWRVDPEGVQVLVPYLKRIFDHPTTSLSAVWHLFEPVAQMLGPQAASDHLIMTLTSFLDPERPSQKHMKLYHRSCLLQWIIRLGFNNFLNHFVTLIIEATGGFRDFSNAPDGSRDVGNCAARKGSHLRSPELDQLQLGTAEENVSPYDEDLQPYEAQRCEALEPEIFAFESAEDETVPEAETVPKEVSEPHWIKENTAIGSEVQDDSTLDRTEVERSDYVESEQAASSVPFVCDWPASKSSLEEVEVNCDQLDSSSPSQDEYNISDVATESVLWLAHRMGPVLTAKHLSRNLLRMLTLCYLGREQTRLVQHCNHASGSSGISLSGTWVRGDASASKVLLCLGNIADLYGENFVTLQYFPHCIDLIGLCKRRMTETLEAGLIGVVSLMQHVVPYLSDATLMDHLQDTIIRDVLYPLVRLVSSLRFAYPGGSSVRLAVTSKLVNVLYIIGSRIGFEMTRKHLSLVLQKFFSAFDKAHEPLVTALAHSRTSSEGAMTPKSLEDYLEIKKSSQGNDYFIGSTVRLDSLSPQPVTDGSKGPVTSARALEELKQVFTPQLAYLSYVPFCKLAGGIYMEQTLKNDELIRQLCVIHDTMLGSKVKESQENSKTHKRQPSRGLEEFLVSGEFGKNVAVVGNRINVQLEEEEHQRTSNAPCTDPALLRRRGGEGGRHLKGNWRAYWEHEIGRSDKDRQHFNFKQIKLQSFTGHNGSIRAIQVLENENSFLTGSKDKTVKLWSLRSSGDGCSSTPCQWTYGQHRKSVFSIAFLDSLRLVGSCDSTVHIWDPFMGSCVYQLDSSKGSPVTLMAQMPAPSTSFLVATTHSTVRFLDARIGKYQHEFKVSLGPAGLIRCLTVSPSGNWIAVGHSSGIISVLDVRTGMLLGSRPCHEGEILQLRAFDETTFVSSSLDHSLAVWSADDIKLNCNLRGPTEPVTCVSFYKGQVVTGTTANRIGVHTSVEHQGAYSSTRLLSDTFKGVLTSMALLPINRLLLLGADNGSLSLLC